MAQTVLANTPAQPQSPPKGASINVPLNFNLQPVDARLLGIPAANSQVEQTIARLNARVAVLPVLPTGVKPQLDRPAESTETEVQRANRLGILAKFKGTFDGPGFNMIFRPKSSKPMETDFKIPLNAAIPADDNVLEFNLTWEELAFSDQLGLIPNRGDDTQADISLTGVSYVQSVWDVTNPDKGLGNATGKAIHFEPGMWILTPPTTKPSSSPILSRMASIPHGTVINASGPAPTGQPVTSTVVFPPASIKPFGGDQAPPNGGGITFNNTQIDNKNSRRLPQDLSLFNQNQTITQQIIDDPNTVLRQANVGKKIVSTTTFTVSTNNTPKSGIANIPFLGLNAEAVQVDSTFWVQTLEYQLDLKAGMTKDTVVSPKNMPKNGLAPTFRITNDQPLKADQLMVVQTTQIQYSQVVMLFFQTLRWPHVSVATLQPKEAIPIVVA